MTIQDYQPFVDRMISLYEGKYGWNHNDPGGPTNFGVSCWDLAEFEGKPMNSMLEWAPIVAAMSLSTAETIYKTKYAVTTRFMDMDAGKDCVVFDFDVNSGNRAIKIAQRVVGEDQDGVLGPLTFKAIQAYDPLNFINDVCDERMSFLESLSTWPVFRKGWTARVTDLRAYCKNLVLPVGERKMMVKPALALPRGGKAYDSEIPPL